MPKGVWIPGVGKGTFEMDDMPIRNVVERVRLAWGRLNNGEQAKVHSPPFGKMTHEDRTRRNLRQAERHLGFLDQ